MTDVIDVYESVKMDGKEYLQVSGGFIPGTVI